MQYTLEENKIKIFSKEEFNPTHILECGQVFCQRKNGNIYQVFPDDKYAEIEEFNDFYEIRTKNCDFFINFFDLKQNYQEIKENLSKFNILKKPLQFGYGIRILNQNLFETLISFIISSNNNIKRITLILNNIRKNLGEQIKDDLYSFPSHQKLLEVDQDFFVKMGAGYRAKYLFQVLRQIDEKTLQDYKKLDTPSLQNKLLSLSGVGPKVADCLLLFGYHRGDVFPVDTWIHQMYNCYYPKLENREVIRRNLVAEFGQLSGYAQQYLFYFQRCGDEKSLNNIDKL